MSDSDFDITPEPSFWTWLYRGFDETDPDIALSLIEKAYQMAVQANASARDLLYIRHWWLQTLIFDKGDIGQALDMAIRAAVEARKPAYLNFMQRICIHQDVIHAYLGHDPYGYSDLIEQSIDYMQAQTENTTFQCRYCMQGARAAFETSIERWDRAEVAIDRYIEMSQYFSHHLRSAYLHRCDLLKRREAWAELLGVAEAADELCRKDLDEYRGSLATALAYQGLAYHHLGDEEKARKLIRSASAHAVRYKNIISSDYYDTMVDYYHLVENLPTAIRIYDRQIKGLEGLGQTYWEARARLLRARLLKEHGKSILKEAPIITELAQKLQRPEAILTQLDQLMASGSTG
ncbi:MAG: hypothetical protein MUF87_09070 [Anaerolineae bacterium]|jgi:hypothetical protein|nr:hypothetical protein [Anaerolineae bacterium]